MAIEYKPTTNLSHRRCHAPGGKWPARPAEVRRNRGKEEGRRGADVLPSTPHRPERCPPGTAAPLCTSQRKHQPTNAAPKKPRGPGGRSDPGRETGAEPSATPTAPAQPGEPLAGTGAGLAWRPRASRRGLQRR